MINEELFRQFISLSCNRLDFIQNYLNSNGIDTAVISLNGKNHIYIKFPLTQYNSTFKVKTIIAHYDRAEGTPGANDNSAAVFCLMEWAIRLNNLYKTGKIPFHNIRLIFTDGEEEGDAGVCEQGAFALASIFKKLNILDDDIFVFDCMGRGTVPVICENNPPAASSSFFKNRITELENKAEKILSEINNGKWFKMPASYSDNASFIANGIPAIAITMLPSDEISSFLKYGIKPATWNLLHTPKDDFTTLTPQAFEITEKILNRIGTLKTIN